MRPWQSDGIKYQLQSVFIVERFFSKYLRNQISYVLSVHWQSSYVFIAGHWYSQLPQYSLFTIFASHIIIYGRFYIGIYMGKPGFQLTWGTQKSLPIYRLYRKAFCIGLCKTFPIYTGKTLRRDTQKLRWYFWRWHTCTQWPHDFTTHSFLVSNTSNKQWRTVCNIKIAALSRLNDVQCQCCWPL